MVVRDNMEARMTLKPLILSLAVLAVGCSSSDDDNNDLNPNDSTDPALSDGSIQFSEPDVNGSSDLARLGYPVVRDLSRELVTGAYLNAYFDIDGSVVVVLKDALGGESVISPGSSGESGGPVACPQGGTIDASFNWNVNNTLTFEGTFADCMIDDQTLSGDLMRVQDAGVTGGGGYNNISMTFTDFSINSEEVGALLVTGTATRTSSYSSSGLQPPEELGSCILEDNLHLTESSAIYTAQIERPGIAGSVTVSQSDYARDDNRRYDANSNETTCPLFRQASETGSAIVTFDGYGASALDGQATTVTAISTLIDDNTNTNDVTASQSSELPDGSSVRMTALSGTDGTVQVDILADGAAISFVDSYQFVAPDFEL